MASGDHSGKRGKKPRGQQAYPRLALPFQNSYNKLPVVVMEERVHVITFHFLQIPDVNLIHLCKLKVVAPFRGVGMRTLCLLICTFHLF